MKKKSKRGGARPGAGRKPTGKAGSPFDGASAQAIRDGLGAAGLGALFT